MVTLVEALDSESSETETKLGRAEGGATLDRILPVLGVEAEGSIDSDDEILLSESRSKHEQDIYSREMPKKKKKIKK